MLLAKNPDISEDDGLVYYRYKNSTLLYIPRDTNLRNQILAAHHDTPLAGHPGKHKTVALVMRNYWWPGMRNNAETYVLACPNCQVNKTRTGPIKAPLLPHDAPPYPWHTIGIDFVGPLPISDGYDFICTIVDKLTKMVILVPCTTKITAEGTARIYRDNVLRRFGIPKKIISDRGPQFVSEFAKELASQLKQEINMSSAYHPETNGQTERMNKEVSIYLRNFVNGRQDNWADWLPLAEFAINNRDSSVTGHSPFYLNHGRHPNTNFSWKPATTNESAAQFAAQQAKAWQDAQAAIDLAAGTTKKYEDTHRAKPRDYKVGDLVYVDNSNFRRTRASSKLDMQRYGPYAILEIIGEGAYRVDIPKSWMRINPVFRESHLTPHVPPAAPHQAAAPRPTPETIGDEDDHYELEDIIDERMFNGRHQYRCVFKDMPRHEDEWKNADDINAPELLAEYRRRRRYNEQKRDERNARSQRVRFIADDDDDWPLLVPAEYTPPTADEQSTWKPVPLLRPSPAFISHFPKLAELVTKKTALDS